MGRSSRRDHIRALRRREALPRRNILRLTLPHVDILAALAAIKSASAEHMKHKYNTRNMVRIIEENWFGKNRMRADVPCCYRSSKLRD